LLLGGDTSPCFWHDNVRDGSIAVGLYSIGISICIITFTIYLLLGGDTSQLWLPFFETDLNSGSLYGSGGFVLIYFFVMIILSLMLIFGVKRDIRGLMLPWVYASYVAILFQAMYGLWMVFGYYIYLEMVFSALCNFTWMGLNIYCIMVVKSHVRNVKLFQSPDIEYYQDI